MFLSVEPLSDEGRLFELFNALSLDAWIAASERKDDKLAAYYQRRFTPEFRVAFEARLKTDPLQNPAARPGPFIMPEYRNARLERSKELHQEASAVFTEGTEARETAEKYVRSTVLLATILFLIALAQRFKLRKVRMGLFLVAAILMVYAITTVAMYPRL
jgi:hypothetical protein